MHHSSLVLGSAIHAHFFPDWGTVMRCVVLGLVVAVLMPPAAAQAQDAKGTLAERVEQLGGRVRRQVDVAGSPIYAIYLHTLDLTDAQLKEFVKEFARLDSLRTLSLASQKVT